MAWSRTTVSGVSSRCSDLLSYLRMSTARRDSNPHNPKGVYQLHHAQSKPRRGIEPRPLPYEGSVLPLSPAGRDAQAPLG